MKRRALLKASLVAVVGLGSIGCASSDVSSTPDSGGGGNCKANGIKSATIDDPKHMFVAPSADVIAGAAKTYSIQGTQTHDHTISLTATDFTKLQNGQSVTVTSTTTLAHDHVVTVVCA